MQEQNLWSRSPSKNISPEGDFRRLWNRLQGWCFLKVIDFFRLCEIRRDFLIGHDQENPGRSSQTELRPQDDSWWSLIITTILFFDRDLRWSEWSCSLSELRSPQSDAPDFALKQNKICSIEIGLRLAISELERVQNRPKPRYCRAELKGWPGRSLRSR